MRGIVGLGEGFGVMLIVLLGVGSTVGRFLFASLTTGSAGDCPSR